MHINEFLTKCKQILHIGESVGSVLFWIFALYGFDMPYIAGITLICAMIHESGHECFLIYNIGNGGRLYGTPRGFRIKRYVRMSYGSEIGLYAAGPFANLAVALSALPFYSALDGYISVFITVNIATAVSNLMPVKGFDGYGIIRTLLDGRGASLPFYKILDGISLTLCMLFVLLSLYLMARFGEGYWIFAVFFTSMLAELNNMFGSKK